MITEQDAQAGSRPGSGDTVARIYEAIRESILNGELEPGEVISQVKLAGQFETGRTPVREALRMLQRERLIEGEYNRRVRVAPYSVSDFEQLYALRIVAEAYAVRVSTPKFTAEDLDRLEEAAGRMVEAAQERDLLPWEAAHRVVHTGLSAYSGERTIQHIATMMDHAQRYRRLIIRTDPIGWTIGTDLTTQVVTACRERDAIGASQQLAIQLNRVVLVGASLLEPSHDPVLARCALNVVISESR